MHLDAALCAGSAGSQQLPRAVGTTRSFAGKTGGAEFFMALAPDVDPAPCAHTLNRGRQI